MFHIRGCNHRALTVHNQQSLKYFSETETDEPSYAVWATKHRQHLDVCISLNWNEKKETLLVYTFLRYAVRLLPEILIGQWSLIIFHSLAEVWGSRNDVKTAGSARPLR